MGSEETPIARASAPAAAGAVSSPADRKEAAKSTLEDGPPSSPWAVAALLVATLGAFSWFFKIWDESEFPETFWSPFYWLGIGTLFFGAAIWAFLVASKKSRLDTALTIALTATGVGAFFGASFAWREALPSDNTFTIAVFNFAGDNTPIQDDAMAFRGTLLESLQEFNRTNAKSAGADLAEIRPRDRWIKGETPDEQLAFVQKWAKRRHGSHLAIWAEVHMRPDGLGYKGKLHFVKIRSFGTETRTRIWGSFRTQTYPSRLSRQARIAR